jgi:hypothetical protein
MVRNKGERSLLSGNASAVSYLRVVLGTSYAGEGTFLLYPRQGYLQVIIVLQRFPYQTLKHRILE